MVTQTGVLLAALGVNDNLLLSEPPRSALTPNYPTTNFSSPLLYDNLACAGSSASSPLTLAAALDINGTTLVLPGALQQYGANIPSLTGNDYIAVTLSPVGNPNSTSTAERAWIVGYVSGALTAIVLRGQEGSAPVAHANGEPFVLSAAAANFIPHRPIQPLWRRANRPPATGSTPTFSPTVVLDNTTFNEAPGICVGRNGTIFVTYEKGTGDDVAGNTLTLISSSDGGKTWSTTSRPAGIPPADTGYFDSGIVCTWTGRLIASFHIENDTAGTSVAAFIYSDDDGASWSPIQYPPQFYPYSRVVGTAGYQHTSGVLIWPVYGCTPLPAGSIPAPSAFGSGVYLSYDNGTSWPTFIPINAVGSGFTESTVVEWPDASLSLFFRSEGAGARQIWRCDSNTLGLSWTAPVALPFNVNAGRPSAALFPASQTLIMFFRSNTTSNANAFRWSLDRGKTWSPETLWFTSTYSIYANLALSGPDEAVLVVAEGSAAPNTLNFNIITAGVAEPGHGPLSVQSKTRTAGDVTPVTGSWNAVDTALDLTLPARVDSVIGLTPSGMCSMTATGSEITFDAVTVVSGSSVNSVSSGTATPVAYGVTGWFVGGLAGDCIGPGGTFYYAVRAGDLNMGQVTVRLMVKALTASQTIYAHAGVPLVWQAAVISY